MKNNRKNSPSYPIGRRIHDIDRLQSYDIQTNFRSYVMLLIIRTWTQSVVVCISLPLHLIHIPTTKAKN